VIVGFRTFWMDTHQVEGADQNIDSIDLRHGRATMIQFRIHLIHEGYMVVIDVDPKY
jgi:hypothetical protein